MEDVVAVPVPVRQKGDAVLALPATAAQQVVGLRFAQTAGRRPPAAGVRPDLDALRGPDPAVDGDRLKFRIFLATRKVAEAAAGPHTVNVG